MIIARAVTLRRPGAESPARRDLWAGLALAASWLAVWGVYSAYYWTNDPSEGTLQTVRFYVPAIGAISLLGAWLVTRIPGRAWLAGSPPICGYRGLLRDRGGYSRSSGSALAVVAGRPGSAQMVVRLMSLPSSMRWPGTS